MKRGGCTFVACKTLGCQLPKKREGGVVCNWYPTSKRQCPPPPTFPAASTNTFTKEMQWEITVVAGAWNLYHVTSRHAQLPHNTTPQVKRWKYFQKKKGMFPIRLYRSAIPFLCPSVSCNFSDINVFMNIPTTVNSKLKILPTCIHLFWNNNPN